MATTTTNFGWDIPQSTDLVKDGATAIAALGQDIDTSMMDLKGGTTGQVLKKASNTDMDFTWSSETGDIEGVTAGTGLTGGGTSGTVTLDFDVANYGGGQYSAGKNKIINGAFDWNQRSFTSTTTASSYGFDRWLSFMVDGTTTYSAQTFTAGTAPVAGYEATNFARIQTTGQTLSSAQSTLSQKIEDVRVFANQTLTVSFWAKAASGTPKIAVEINQNFGSGGSATVTNYAGQVTISTSWARYSVTYTMPSISGKTIGTSSFLGLNLYASAGSDFNARTGSLGIQTNTFDFWGVQAEAGSTATPFQTATGTKQGELAACQRYYQLIASGNSKALSMGFTYSTSALQGTIPLLVQMRTTPTLSLVSGTGYYQIYTTSAKSFDDFSLDATTTSSIAVIAKTGLTGFTAGQAGYIYTNNASAFVAVQAEL